MSEVFTSLTMSGSGVEEAREICGLLIVVMWLSYLFLRQRSRVLARGVGS